jgi:hypothetical protein
MKTVEMFRDYDYAAHPRVTIRFHAGITYARVIEAAAREIERAEAGRIVVSLAQQAVGCTIDAGHAFRRKRK